MKRLMSLVVLVLVMASCQQTKIAYVDSGRLFEQYKPIKEANARFQKQLKNVQTQLQDKVSSFRKKVQRFRSEQKSMSAEKKKAKRQQLMMQQQQIRQMRSAKSQKIKQKQTQVIDSIKKEVKAAVKDYAESKGYSFVFGLNEETNQIVYAKESQNITDEILSTLNSGSTSSSKSINKAEKKSNATNTMQADSTAMQK